jgi:hypothetical protein
VDVLHFVPGCRYSLQQGCTLLAKTARVALYALICGTGSVVVRKHACLLIDQPRVQHVA